MTKKINVGFLLYPGCTLLDFAGALQVLAYPMSPFNHFLIAEYKEITTTENVTVHTDYDLKSCPSIDILFVPGGGGKGVTDAMANQKLLDFIVNSSADCLWKGSVCTGAFILAAAGILHDCKVTTYWSQLNNLSRLSESLNLEVPLDSYPRYIFDKKNKIFTGGGISSSIDLALELYILIAGKAEAKNAQLFVQYQPNPPLDSGDPNHASADTLQEVSIIEQDFVEEIGRAVDRLLMAK